MSEQQHTKPLAGLKVVELGTLIAGPFATRLMAEFGAEVIKIESPDGGDPLRQWRMMHEGTSLWWYLQARNKKSITVNLKHPDGLDIVRRLLRDADILVENFRPGVLEKLGLSWEALSAENPRLVMVRLSGYGQTGPYKDKPGFGAIGEAMGGMRFITGFPDRPPVKLGISIGDSIAALYAVIGSLMALRHREKLGKGQVVDVALYEAVFSMMESLVPEFDVTGYVRERNGNIMPGITPSNTYTARDGKPLIIGANGDAIFKRLMVAMKRPDLASDPQLADNVGRSARADEIYAAIGDWVAAHDFDYVINACEIAEVPATKIFSIADIVEDPQYLARGMIESALLPSGQAFKLPGIVPKMSDTPGSTEWVGPALGQHTDQVLDTLGFSSVEIKQMKENGAI